MLINFIVNIAGAITGLVFIYFSIKASRSLVGSFFKKSYYRLAVGSLALTASFLFEIASFFGLLNENIADTIHHTLMLITSVLFIFVSLAFAKETAAYMGSKEKIQ